MTKYTKECVLTSHNVFFLSILQYHLAFYLSYFTRRCKCYLEQCTLKYTLYDLSNHFYSSEVKERVDKLAHSLRLPPYTVLPMKNMDTEQRINNSVNILALYNLRQMLRAADDFLLNYLDEFKLFLDNKWSYLLH
jgi:hypothetical protein